jgi:hypothetical protein
MVTPLPPLGGLNPSVPDVAQVLDRSIGSVRARAALLGLRKSAEFFASPSTAQGWGRDRLGEVVLPPGQYLAIRLPEGECGYDLRWVFQGGGAEERRNVNTCATNNYIVR